MGITDHLPFNSPEVRENVERLFSRKMLGSVLVGKFFGDYIALVTTGVLGVHLGYLSGITLSIAVFIYWERLERAAQSAQNEMSQAQTSLNDFN